MLEQAQLGIFGYLSNFSSLEDIESLIQANPADTELRTKAAAFGLSLAAWQAVRETTFFEDSRHVADEVAKAKARIDTAAWHSLEVTRATAAILLAAQQFLKEQTLACTEWPSPGEVAATVLEAAHHVATV